MNQNNHIVYTIKNGCMYDQNDRMVAVLTEDATEADERTIELSSEALPVIDEYIVNVKSGNFKPRTAVKKLEEIIEKYS